jgi:ABC-type transport system substrate-binding protein
MMPWVFACCLAFHSALATSRGWSEEAAATTPPPAAAAKSPEPPKPLLEQEPFDLILLDSANGDKQLKVVPMMDGKRKSPFAVDLAAKYRVRPLDKEGVEFEVDGKHIVRIELFEEQLLKEARRLIAANDFDGAFKYILLLQANYPELPGLNDTIKEFLYLDAFQLTRNKQFSEAMGIVEDLFRMQRDYRYNETAQPLPEFLGRLIDKLMSGYVEQGNFWVARTLLNRLSSEYGNDRPPTVDNWKEQLSQMAIQKRDEARKQMEAEQFHEALVSIRQMFNIWPDAQGGAELRAELARRYPLVTVGVLQSVRIPDAQRLDDWAARRTGRLLNRDMIEFHGAGPEGGQYDFQSGSIEHSEDRRTMILRINRVTEDSSAATAFDVANRLLDYANATSPSYSEAWAALISAIQVRGTQEVDVQLRRPHVLPEAVLRVAQRPAPVTGDSLPAGNGRFAMAVRTDAEVRFVVKGFRVGGKLAEITERRFSDGQQALAALHRGDVDMVERIPPAEAVRIRKEAKETDIQVQPYTLPTVHMLVINSSKNPFLAQRDFRRAIEFAVDRQTILTQEILAGTEVPGCQLVSGPFPVGASDSDPLGYAYDARIRPRPYDPRLAKLLSTVAQKQVADLALKRGDAAPKLAPLVLGFPDFDTARITCQAAAAYLKAIGLECALKQFPPGETRDSKGECDLVFTEIAVWEPAVDASRLLGLGGPAECDSPYVQQALRRLDAAQNWGEVRERLLQVHRSVHEEAAVIPLWQMVDFLAYHKRLTDVGDNLVWLYQNVDQWRISNEAKN